MVFMKKKEIIICSSIIMSCLLLIYFYYENTTLQITNYSISSSKIPNEFNDYKIIQISDYHNERSNRLNKFLIEKLKNEKPDIIVITGDFIDPNRMHMEQSINFVKEIKGIAPIYYVSGNHEAKISNYEEWKNLLEEQGVIILENETKIIEKENSKINIIGINDPKMAHEKSVKNSTIINKELEISNYNKDLFSILLSHRPEVFRTYVENNIDFQLQINGNIYHMTNNYIAKEDLEILLADHIKDAIIAINHSENINKSILVRIGKIDGIYGVYFYDSGIEFEFNTLLNLGKIPITTHKSEGGTGMGFMNTFKTLSKTKGSLEIEEIGKPSKSNFTKVLKFKFNNKNEYKIISYKGKELKEKDEENKLIIENIER